MGLLKVAVKPVGVAAKGVTTRVTLKALEAGPVRPPVPLTLRV